jgi:hypothetical protein
LTRFARASPALFPRKIGHTAKILINPDNSTYNNHTPRFTTNARANRSFRPRVETQLAQENTSGGASADNLTLAMVGFPEYPLD